MKNKSDSDLLLLNTFEVVNTNDMQTNNIVKNTNLDSELDYSINEYDIICNCVNFYKFAFNSCLHKCYNWYTNMFDSYHKQKNLTHYSSNLSLC